MILRSLQDNFSKHFLHMYFLLLFCDISTFFSLTWFYPDPFLLFKSPRALSPRGPPNFLSTCLGIDSLTLSMRFSRQELKWAAIPFSRGPSQPRDLTQVSCTAGRLFTFWAIMGNSIKWFGLMRSKSSSCSHSSNLFYIAG